MNGRLLAVTLGVCLISALVAGAYDFQPIGFESVSMGGAGVASAKGSMAGYYNPALLAKVKRSFELGLGGGVAVRENGLLDRLQTLVDNDVDGTLNDVQSGLTIASAPSFDATTNTRLTAIKSSFVSMAGLVTPASAGLQPDFEGGVQLGSLSIGAYATTNGVAESVVVPTATDLIFKKQQQTTSLGMVDVYFRYDPSTQAVSYAAFQGGAAVDISGEVPGGYTPDPTLDEANYQANSLYNATLVTKATHVKLTGSAITEVPVAFASELNLVVTKVAIGVAIKPMKAYTFNTTAGYDLDEDGIADAFKTNQTESTAFGVDAGVLISPPFLKNVTIGAVAKNINKPKFENDAGLTVMTMEPFYRAGININMGKAMTIAADYDLEVTQAADGSNVRYAGGGISLKPIPLINLRVGAMQNLESADDEIIYTAGVALGFKWAQLAVAGQMSNKNTVVDGEELPRYTRVSASFISRW